MSEAYWYNYRTGAYELRSTPTTDEEAITLLPDDPSARGLYELYRQHGNKSILEAMANVLHSAVGEDPPFPLEGKR